MVGECSDSADDNNFDQFFVNIKFNEPPWEHMKMNFGYFQVT